MFQIKAHQSIKDSEAFQQSDPEFSRAPELWVIDESSFLSQRQKSQLDRLAEQAGAKVVYVLLDSQVLHFFPQATKKNQLQLQCLK